MINRPGAPAKKGRQEASAHGWYSRDYLPHCDVPGLLQMITCRLADALPHHRAHQLQQQANDDIQLRKKIDAWLDAGHGQCWLRDPANAAIVEQGFQRFDGERYYLLAWCIMPNHFHVIIETLPDHPVSGIIHSWKSYSAKQINRRLGRAGTVWQREYFDRYIRDGHHLAAATGYIHQNPVKKPGFVRPPPYGRSAVHGLWQRMPARRRRSQEHAQDYPMAQIKTPKKLIEVALPLDDINAATAREKSIRRGHRTGEIDPARPPLNLAPVVGAPSIGGGKGRAVCSVGK